MKTLFTKTNSHFNNISYSHLSACVSFKRREKMRKICNEKKDLKNTQIAPETLEFSSKKEGGILKGRASEIIGEN